MADGDSHPITEETAASVDAGLKEALRQLGPAAFTSIPKRIGRYRVDRQLGRGGFGVVFLAQDEQLNRSVAVKVPHVAPTSRPTDAEAYLAEARTVANLRHPAIVPVFDVGSTDEFPCYIVSEFIAGTDLAKRIKQRRLSYFEAVELVAVVAEALHFAHKQGVVHRDVKPGNILIGTDSKPYVVDFGLALREENVGKGEGMGGTPAYMSPEQARGEGHRVDGRCDIFSLGVVFYELLVGRRPFRAETLPELQEQIISHEPRPPRQHDDSIPKELERICLKMLSKRATDRYTTAKDLADDLRVWLATAAPEEAGKQPSGSVTEPFDARAAEITPPGAAGSSSQAIKIVPKGMRSFDEHDADFFLELLPGARDREGLPDSIRFWKTRIEESDSDKTFSVGLIYGPSGCGKSSLVKAGLLPRLSQSVISVYVEATPDETESRLLHALRKHCPGLEKNLSLKDTLAALRRGQGIPVDKKVLIVLDQFEQWLHAKKEQENAEMVQALRQCDGGHVQCIVMVRDDFWMAVTRFLVDLEVELVQGRNLFAVDLFDLRHARGVLSAIGRAFGTLPESVAETTAEQRQLLDKAVSDLGEDGKVVCVRLALFAEMMKGKPWTPESLKEVGGTKGIGVTFLEETFSSPTANPKHRLHQNAARAVLNALLSESGTDIKGNMLSYDELREASGYTDRAKDFDDLMRILDSEVRLITPTDLEGAGAGKNAAPQAAAGRKYYQLTHDYLVPSLRDWLTRKQKETKRGRAELRLAERSALWNSKPEKRHLPSLWEYSNIRFLSNRKNWTEPQQKMMSRAGWVHGVRCGILGVAMAAIVAAGFIINGRIEDQENKHYASAIVQSLMAASTADVEKLIEEVDEYREWATPLLEKFANDETSDSKERLHASLALVDEDPSQVDYLANRLLTTKADEVPVIVKFLSPYKDRLNNRLWQTVRGGSGEQRIRAAAALAEHDPENDAWRAVNSDVVTALVSVPTVEAKQWIDMLRPAGRQLVEPLEARYRDRSPNRNAERPLAAAALADYLSDPQKLIELLLLADNEREFLPLLGALRPQQKSASTELKKLLSQSPADDAKPEIADALWKKQAKVAVCLLGLEEQDAVWPLLKHSPNPSLRSFIIDRLARMGGNFGILIDHLARESDSATQYAVVLALGEFDAGKLSNQQRQSVVEQLTALYRTNPDSGVHSAAAWTLRRWQEEPTVKRLDAELRSASSDGRRNWFVNSQGQTFVVVSGPGEFVMGEKPREKKVRLAHRFAVADHEVTVSQFQQFREDHKFNAVCSPQADCPTNTVSWYDAVAYCNWLSQQEAIPKDGWCYEPNDKGEYAEGMKIPADFLQRTGYRLPLEAEWEYACRAGTTSAFSFGDPVELLDRYVWYNTNSQNRMWPVGRLRPNGLGLFDMHGNAWEWCHDLSGSKSDDAGDVTVKHPEGHVLRGGAFYLQPVFVRSTGRYTNQSDFRLLNNGFRVARTSP